MTRQTRHIRRSKYGKPFKAGRKYFKRELEWRFDNNKFAFLIERIGSIIDQEKAAELGEELGIERGEYGNIFELLELIFNKLGVKGKIQSFMFCGE